MVTKKTQKILLISAAMIIILMNFIHPFLSFVGAIIFVTAIVYGEGG